MNGICVAILTAGIGRHTFVCQSCIIIGSFIGHSTHREIDSGFPTDAHNNRQFIMDRYKHSNRLSKAINEICTRHLIFNYKIYINKQQAASLIFAADFGRVELDLGSTAFFDLKFNFTSGCESNTSKLAHPDEFA